MKTIKKRKWSFIPLIAFCTFLYFLFSSHISTVNSKVSSLSESVETKNKEYSALTTADNFLFPFNAYDLSKNVRVFSNEGPSHNHRNSKTQNFALDLTLKKYYDRKIARGIWKKVSITGTPFYAIADGEVCACWRNAPDTGKKDPKLKQRLLAGGGNHLWVKLKDGRWVLYAHATAGSIPKSLCPYDAKYFSKPKPRGRFGESFIPKGKRPKIKKGQYLGKVGNSGSSSGPHLHLHLQSKNPEDKTAKGLPIKFSGGSYKPYYSDNTSIDKNWQKIKGALPLKPILILPSKFGARDDNYVYAGTFRKTNKAQKHWRAEWSPMVTQIRKFREQGYHLRDIETLVKEGKRYYQGVFEKKSGKSSITRVTSYSAFQSKVKELRGKGYRLIDFETILTTDKKKRYFVGAFPSSSRHHTIHREEGWSNFVAKWKVYAKQEMMLDDIELGITADGRPFYYGVFSKSKSKRSLFKHYGWPDYYNNFKKMLKNGYTLLDFEIIKRKNKSSIYLSVYKKSNATQYMYSKTGRNQFTNYRNAKAKEGYQLADIEVLK